MKKLVLVLFLIIIGCSKPLKNESIKEEIESTFFQSSQKLQNKNDSLILEYNKIDKEYYNFEQNKKFNFKDLNSLLSDEKYDYKCLLLGSKMREMNRKVRSIESIKSYYDSDSLILKFNVYANCCDKFYADYYLKNRQLSIQLNSISSVICDCNCGFEYQFTIFDKNRELKLDSVFIKK